MAWTTPPTWTTGQILTSSELTIVSADLTWLYGDSVWTTPSAFTNGWTNSNGVSFIRHGNLVHLRGILGAGTAGDAAFTLPAGYRPSQSGNYPVVGAAGAVIVLSILPSGAVVPTVSSANDISGVIFSII